jgi:predicted transcriptional regulator
MGMVSDQIYLTVLPIARNTYMLKKQYTPMESLNQITKKDATCTDLLTCLYNLKPADIETIYAILTNPNAKIDQIATEVHKDRTSVHRTLSKLVSIGLVTKQTKTIKGGGYYHTYAMLDPALIKKHARERVKEITESLDNLIDHFGEEFEKHLKQQQSQA